MQAERTRRSRWTLLLGAAMTAVAIVSLLTFATLARRTSLKDAPGPRVAAIDPGSAPGQINLPSPSPSGGDGPADEQPIGSDSAVALVPLDAPGVDPNADPDLIASRSPGGDDSGDGSAGTGTKASQPRATRSDGSGPGRDFASNEERDKPGKGPKHKAAKSHPAQAGRPAHAQPAKAHGHGSSRGKGHSKGRGKGHAKHGD